MIETGYHKPVMLREVEEYLICDTSGIYADCTLGGAGHSYHLLNKFPKINIVGVDCDEDAILESKNKLSRFEKRVQIVRGNFRNIREILDSLKIKSINGILLDLGVSSRQLENLERGFSFKSPVLDMRMDNRLKETAKDLINNLDKNILRSIFYEYGEEKLSNKISETIINERMKNRITSSTQLASLIEKAVKRHSRIHPATKVFQAIRIKLNNELENLQQLLNQLPLVLNKSGRAVVISYHSLEDRIVKNSFRLLSREGGFKLLTKKVIFPLYEEIRNNNRSRSAKLRAITRV